MQKKELAEFVDIFVAIIISMRVIFVVDHKNALRYCVLDMIDECQYRSGASSILRDFGFVHI